VTIKHSARTTHTLAQGARPSPKLCLGWRRREVAASPSSSTMGPVQSASEFPLHRCGVQPTVSEESPFNEHVCGAAAKHTLNACEAMC